MAYILLLFQKVGKALNEEILDKHKTQTWKTQITFISSIKEMDIYIALALLSSNDLQWAVFFPYLHFT